jgi:hypothetical protein
MDVKWITDGLLYISLLTFSAPGHEPEVTKCATLQMEGIKITTYKRESADVPAYNTSNIDPAWLPVSKKC